MGLRISAYIELLIDLSYNLSVEFYLITLLNPEDDKWHL